MRNKIKKYIKNRKSFHNFLLNFRELARIIYNTKTRSRFFWNLRKGDNTITLNHELNTESIVFDIGAYEGNFTQKVYEKFNCYVYAFEPLPEKYKFLVNKFENFSKISIYSFGLYDKNMTADISLYDAGSSLFIRPEASPSLKINLKSFDNFLVDNGINKVDYLYMNIEGSEYKLLNHIIETGNIKKIGYLQIQFHNYIKDAKKLRKKIRSELKTTHQQEFNYPFIWEGWKLKSSNT